MNNTEIVEPEIVESHEALVLPFQAPHIAQVITSSETWPALKSDILAALDQVRALPTYAPLKREMSAALEDAQALSVTDRATYDRADVVVPQLGALADRAKTWWEPVTSLAFKLHRWLTARRAVDVDPLEAQRARLLREAGAWDREQQRLQRERDAQAALEAKKKADAEALHQAELLTAQGLPELAEAVVEQAIATPAPAVSTWSAPKAKNLSHGEDWEIDIINEALVPREYMAADKARILKVVRALKGAIKIPGVRITETTATRGKRRSA